MLVAVLPIGSLSAPMEFVGCSVASVVSNVADEITNLTMIQGQDDV